MSAAILRLAGLSCAHPGQAPAFSGIDLELREDERLALTGPCGAGKSTLLHALVGLVPAVAGEIEIFGRKCVREADFAPLRGPLGLLFQDSDDQLFCPTVLEDVAFGPLNQGLARNDAYGRARQALDQLGIESLGERVVQRLSGGEKRLAALAGILAMQPRLLLLDEPTAALDPVTAARIVAALVRSGLPMVVASHDPHCIAGLTTRAFHLG